MAKVKKPTIQMNWSKRTVIEISILRKTMPFKRFLQISMFAFYNSDFMEIMENKICDKFF